MLFMSSSFTSSTGADSDVTSHKVAVSAALPLTDIALQPEEARFVDLTNAERVRRGLNPLDVDPLLVEVARAHSRDMADNDYFAHEAPHPELRTPMKRYLARLGHRPRYAMVGENLFYCSKVDVNRGQRAFMDSRDHRENLLNSEFESIGVGIHKSADGAFWVTEMFLRKTPEPAQDPSVMVASTAH